MCRMSACMTIQVIHETEWYRVKKILRLCMTKPHRFCIQRFFDSWEINQKIESLLKQDKENEYEF